MGTLEQKWGPKNWKRSPWGPGPSNGDPCGFSAHGLPSDVILYFVWFYAVVLTCYEQLQYGAMCSAAVEQLESCFNQSCRGNYEAAASSQEVGFPGKPPTPWNIFDLETFRWDYFQILYSQAYLDIIKTIWKKKNHFSAELDKVPPFVGPPPFGLGVGDVHFS